MYHGTAHVILGSGLTIAGATFCLHFTRLPYFQTLGIPLAIGMLVAVIAALTMAPRCSPSAAGSVSSIPSATMRTGAGARSAPPWCGGPGPILVPTIALALIGLLALPGYVPSYNDREFLPDDIPANQGYAAADRHFPQARMNPEMLLVETDHDVRNSADMLVIDRIAKSVFHIPGIGRVQTITRPAGHADRAHVDPVPDQHAGHHPADEPGLHGQDRMADMLTQADDMQTTIDTMEKHAGLTQQMADTTHGMVAKTKNMAVDIGEVRDNIADFDDFFRPIRNYFYWEPHCYDIPVCRSIRSIFDTLDGIDVHDRRRPATRALSWSSLDSLMPQLVAIMPSMIATMKNMKNIMLTMYQSQKGQQDQMKALQENSTAMGQAFDASKNDDSFYLPPEVFDNPDFQRGLKMFVSPDGKAVRFIISHEGDPATPEGISHIDQIKNAAFEAIKGTPLEGSKIYLAGTASTYKDMQHGSNFDLLIAGIASLCLIFIIMLLLTRVGGRRRGDRRNGAVVAGHIVRTVRADMAVHPRPAPALDDHRDVGHHPVGGGIGLQPAAGVTIQGRDPRGHQHRHNPVDGRNGFGRHVGRAGVRLHDDVDGGQRSARGRPGGYHHRSRPVVRHLVIRSFMTPSIAALLGRWFWWPQRVRQRPVPEPWPEPKPEPETESVGAAPGAMRATKTPNGPNHR